MVKILKINGDAGSRRLGGSAMRGVDDSADRRCAELTTLQIGDVRSRRLCRSAMGGVDDSTMRGGIDSAHITEYNMNYIFYSIFLTFKVKTIMLLLLAFPAVAGVLAAVDICDGFDKLLPVLPKISKKLVNYSFILGPATHAK